MLMLMVSITVTYVTKINDQDDAVDVQNGLENEIHDDVNGVRECETVDGVAEVLGDAYGNKVMANFKV